MTVDISAPVTGHAFAASRRVWQWATGRGGDLRRLDWEVARLEQRLEWRRSVLHVSLGPDADGTSHQDGVRGALERARHTASSAHEAWEARNAEKGWTLLAQAQEFEVLCMTRPEVDALRLSLTAEIERDRDGGWWRDAALDLLAQMSGELGPGDASRARRAPRLPRPTVGVTSDDPEDGVAGDLVTDRLLLREALHKRNESLNIRFSMLAAQARDRIWLALILVTLLVLAGALIRDHVGDGQDRIDVPWVAAAAALAGMIGSVTSAMQRLSVEPKLQLPTRLQSFTIVIVQGLIGTVAALTVYVAAVAGVMPLPEHEKVMLLLLAAFGSGFSERLVVYRPNRSR